MTGAQAVAHLSGSQEKLDSHTVRITIQNANIRGFFAPRDPHAKLEARRVNAGLLNRLPHRCRTP